MLTTEVDGQPVNYYLMEPHSCYEDMYCSSYKFCFTINQIINRRVRRVAWDTTCPSRGSFFPSFSCSSYGLPLHSSFCLSFQRHFLLSRFAPFSRLSWIFRSCGVPPNEKKPTRFGDKKKIIWRHSLWRRS
jgi:hypothetical protein